MLSIALAFSTTFVAISDLGIGTLTTREIAKDKSLTTKFIRNIFPLKLVLAIISMLIVFIIANLSNYSPITLYTIYIASLLIIVGVFPGIFLSIFQAYEMMEYPSVNMILNGIFMFLGTFFIIFNGLGVIEFSMLNVIVSAIVLVYCLIVFNWKISSPKFEFDLVFWKKIIKKALPFGLISISGVLYTYLDSIMLSLLQPIEVVGWYSVAYRLILVLLFIPTAFNTAIFPVMSKYFVSAHNSLKLINERYFKLMIIMGIPIGFGTMLLADKIIYILFGSSYLNSVIALQILIWTIVFTFVGASFVQLLQATNREFAITKISLICVLLNLVLNLILIPKFSYVGACFATLITEFVLVSYIIKISYKVGYGIPIRNMITVIAKVVISSLFMSVFIICLNDLNLFLLIILSIFVYISLLLLIRGIDKDDINMIKRLIKC
ncbi:MAG: flippase [Methanobacterium sp.]|uniref:flippase n=1 Tax=Methanobacterium sp. TaxID=2164 RepID=UPI003D8A7318